MTTPKINDESALSINIKWLVQIIILVGTAVYLYLGLENRVKETESEIKSIRYNQNTYIFPDIRVLETEVIEYKLERERVRKELQRLREIVNEKN
jgi:predicted phage-related endonuclease